MDMKELYDIHKSLALEAGNGSIDVAVQYAAIDEDLQDFVSKTAAILVETTGLSEEQAVSLVINGPAYLRKSLLLQIAKLAQMAWKE